MSNATGSYFLETQIDQSQLEDSEYTPDEISEADNLDHEKSEVLVKLKEVGMEEELKLKKEWEDRMMEEVEDRTETSFMNAQGLGMIYWGLSKISANPRKKFHKTTELFIEKTID